MTFQPAQLCKCGHDYNLHGQTIGHCHACDCGKFTIDLTLPGNDRYGDWIETFTGRQFWPLDPRPEDVHPFDLGHALANLCRFTGHSSSFYSVAQHSVLVSRIVPADDALWGLLHDASEAYLCDLARPLKHLPEFAAYREIEDRLLQVIATRFTLPWPMPASVKAADLTLLATEARDLMPRRRGWEELPAPLPEHIEALPPEVAENQWLLRFTELRYEQRFDYYPCPSCGATNHRSMLNPACPNCFAAAHDEPPDRNCVTLPDGSCVGTGCMHDPREPKP